jgi:hypothetical protein
MWWVCLTLIILGGVAAGWLSKFINREEQCSHGMNAIPLLGAYILRGALAGVIGVIALGMLLSKFIGP